MKVQRLLLDKRFLLAIVVVFSVLWWLVSRSSKKIVNITHILPRHPFKRYARRELSQIKEIVIHHSATDSKTTKIRTIAEYHATPGNHICNDGCPGIAYHFCINHRGDIYQVNDLKSITYQCGGCNSDTVGICLIGNYDEETPGERVLKSAAKTIKHINRKVGNNLTISGHYHHKNTSCPGDNTDLNKIVKMVYPLA